MNHARMRSPVERACRTRVLLGFPSAEPLLLPG
jgi:hypothetical protein